MNLIEAVRLIRKELLIKDEPLKAYNLLKELDMSELKQELDNTYQMVRYLFEPEEYRKVYQDDPCGDGEKIEPEQIALFAEKIYPRYEWIIKEIGATCAKTLIDLGCYVGSVVLSAARRGCDAVGVEYTSKAVEIAKGRSARLGTPAEFYCMDLMGYNKSKADMVVCHEVIEHVVDPEKFIKHLLSLTTDGGWCYVTTPNGPFGDGWGNYGHWEYDGKGMRGHVRVFVKSTMQGLLDRCGCEIGLLEEHNDGLLWAKFRKK